MNLCKQGKNEKTEGINKQAKDVVTIFILIMQE